MKILLFISLSLLSSSLLMSQNQQIEQLQRQQQVLQEEIKNTNRLYLDVKRETSTILNRINLISKQIDSRRELITVQRQEIEALRKQESSLRQEITQLEGELKEKQAKYANAIQGMLNHNFSQNKLLFILSGKSLGETLRRMQYLRDYAKWQRSQAEEIKADHRKITAARETLMKARREKEKTLSAIQQEQQRLQDEERARQSEVAEARGKEEQLQQTLREKQRRADQLNRQIERLIAEEVARQEKEAEAERHAAEAEAAKRESKEELAAADKSDEERMTATSKEAVEPSGSAGPKIEAGSSRTSGEAFKLSKNFVANKGKLPMPVTGTATIVGNFGAKKHREWNVTTNSNGVDIQAQRGADIRTVFEGEVSKVFSFPGANTCVIVRHGDYYTFYANIYDLFVKQGDKVETGQTLGRIYTDPDTGLATMHFQLWQKTTKLNPAPWLTR